MKAGRLLQDFAYGACFADPFLTMENFTSSSARQLAQRLRAGELTALQVHDAFAERIGTLNPTLNPWDLTLTPGGSSGGAASAVAAGLCPIAITTDGGGSTRRPAALVGAVGMKPSAGLIAHPYGFEEPVFGNSVIGQITRTVEDVAAMLDVLAGPDLADPASTEIPNAGRFVEGLRDAAREPRIAFTPR